MDKLSNDSALAPLLAKQARTLTGANIKYELATSEAAAVTALGWEVVALDLRRFGSSDLTVGRAADCERRAAALRAGDSNRRISAAGAKATAEMMARTGGWL